MIYIDSNSKQTKFIRVRDNASSFVLTNQTTKVTITIDNVINNSKYYIVDFSDYTGYLQNGQYDYVFHSDNQEVLCTGVLQFGDFNTSKAQYETSFEYVQYDPNEQVIEIPEAVIDITENGTYDVKDFDKAIVDVADEESIAMIGQLEEQITELEDEIENLESTINSYEKEIERLDILKDELQGQIDSVTSINITKNGTYTPPDGILGYNEINVETEKPTLICGGTSAIQFQYMQNDVIPFNIDSSDCTSFKFMFSYCSNLINISELNTSNGTNFSYMFNDCNSLQTIPVLDTSNGTNFYSMFNSCKALQTIPALDTSKGTNFHNMFFNCGVLNTIVEIDLTNGTNFDSMFFNCTKLQNITLKGSINKGIYFNYQTKLTYDSVKSILVAAANTTNTNSKTLTFKIELSDNNGELSNLITTCNSKGWTISGLTLQ